MSLICFISYVSAVCEPECQNGAACVSNDACNCPPTYTGSRCEIGREIKGKLDRYSATHCGMKRVFFVHYRENVSANEVEYIIVTAQYYCLALNCPYPQAVHSNNSSVLC